jgi:hypothetical protein
MQVGARALRHSDDMRQLSLSLASVLGSGPAAQERTQSVSARYSCTATIKGDTVQSHTSADPCARQSLVPKKSIDSWVQMALTGFTSGSKPVPKLQKLPRFVPQIYWFE